MRALPVWMRGVGLLALLEMDGFVSTPKKKKDIGERVLIEKVKRKKELDLVEWSNGKGEKMHEMKGEVIFKPRSKSENWNSGI